MRRPVIHDDSLGQSVGKGEMPLNAGQHISSREEIEAKSSDAKAKAEARKELADKRRRALLVETGLEDSGIEPAPVPEEGVRRSASGNVRVPMVGCVEEDGPAVGRGPVDPRVESLESSVREMRGQMSELMGMMGKMLEKSMAPDGVKRVPVTDPEVARAVAARKDEGE
jgi:hypothetical protein